MSKYAPHRPSNSNPRATSSTICQKCLGRGHFTFQCKGAPVYVSRPSRTQQLEKPGTLAKLRAEGKPSVEVPEEFRQKSGTANKILEEKEKQRAEEQEKGSGRPARKRARRSSRSSRRASDSSSGASDSESNSESDSGSSSGSGSGSDSASSSSHSRSRSSTRDRRRRHPRGRSDSRSQRDSDDSPDKRGRS